MSTPDKWLIAPELLQGVTKGSPQGLEASGGSSEADDCALVDIILARQCANAASQSDNVEEVHQLTPPARSGMTIDVAVRSRTCYLRLRLPRFLSSLHQ